MHRTSATAAHAVNRSVHVAVVKNNKTNPIHPHVCVGSHPGEMSHPCREPVTMRIPVAAQHDKFVSGPTVGRYRTPVTKRVPGAAQKHGWRSGHLPCAQSQWLAQPCLFFGAEAFNTHGLEEQRAFPSGQESDALKIQRTAPSTRNAPRPAPPSWLVPDLALLGFGASRVSRLDDKPGSKARDA